MIFSEFHNRWHRRLVLRTELITAFSNMRTLLDTAGIDIEMICGWRGEKDQAEAVANGNSRATFGNSAHNYGAAFDLVPVVNNQPVWEPAEDVWEKIGMAGETDGLTWGYAWDGDAVVNDKDPTPGSTFNDRPHFEIKNWREKNFELFHTEPPIG